MFTPEFINEERGEFLLVANHCLESRESIQLSIAFNLARISYGLSHLPPHIRWSDHAPVDSFCPHCEAFSKASGLTPPR